ncbi:hypothetical protein W97_02742 [Coniosporium apollinis CBS 100218]|uniref:Uncharacterized protein n=1 Tax=Coniosporium apollinis (strain CBS 100218) TaxID=1168221 RepID=R7YNW8_CONA1|nr:uncharacterized protein W97_02742 [Coniosporium apollinis CBS 100218]EON63514.1 hypothetical protein W97_02742 [Coniosporium apollinis CBS 100218]
MLRPIDVLFISMLVGLLFLPIWRAYLCSPGSHAAEATSIASYGALLQPQELPNRGVGVGFDLTAGYGTVAISYHNGSTANVARVNASETYHKTMSRLSRMSSRYRVSPADARALGDMIKDLRAEAEDFLEYPLSSVVGTIVNLEGLNGNTLDAAFEHAGLGVIQLRFFNYPAYETMTAYAGNGLGICSDYKNRTACKIERMAMQDIYVLSVLYTKTALTVALTLMASANDLYEHPPLKVEDFTLGHDARHQNPNEKYYWEAVKDAVRRAVVWDVGPMRQPAKLLLFGESSGDAKFRAVLNETCQELLEELPQWYDNEPVFVAARGAAELAKRKPFDPWRPAVVQETVDL